MKTPKNIWVYGGLAAVTIGALVWLTNKQPLLPSAQTLIQDNPGPDLSDRIIYSPGPDDAFYITKSGMFYQVYAGPDGRQFWGNYETMDEAMIKLQQGMDLYGG